MPFIITSARLVLAIATTTVMAQDITTRQNVGCGFHMTTGGSYSAAVGQLSSGQARAGNSVPPSLFTWFGDAFSDQQGRGCWWTPPTYILQCDRNQGPDHGFQIGCDGAVSYNGQSTFYECGTGDVDQVNIYLQPNGGNCSTVTLQADSCRPSCSGTSTLPASSGLSSSPPSSSMSSSTGLPTSTRSPTIRVSPFPAGTMSTQQLSTASTPVTTTGTSQPTTLVTTSSSPANTQQSATSAPASSPLTSSTTTTTTTSGCTTVGPEQIVLVDKGNPDVAYGANAGMQVQVSPNASSIFNFRFEDSDVGKTCEIFFTLPPSPSSSASSSAGGQGQQSRYTLNGTGVVSAVMLEDWAGTDTTYNTAPRPYWELGNWFLSSGGGGGGGGGGGEHRFGRFGCPGSTARNGFMILEAPFADTCFECQQGRIPDMIGLYLSKC